MNKKIIMVILAILLLIIIAYTTYAIVRSTNEESEIMENANILISEIIEDECTEEYKSIQSNITEVNSSEEKISANAILILKKYFKQCEHTLNEYVDLPEELVNMTKDEVQAEYPEWEIIGFESGKLTLYKEFEGECGEHFKLKVENGKVMIYIINQDGSESLYEKTDISSEYLTEIDLINMQDGLEIYGKEDLNKIIEDFE